MAALLEAQASSPLPDRDDLSQRNRRPLDPTRMTAARDYVRRCLRRHQPFGVITGSVADREALLARVTTDCADCDDLHAIRVIAPTHSARTFLAACLEQLELGLADAATDRLQELMVVFLRHESARGRRTVVIVERTDHFGLQVFRLMRDLSQVRAGTTPGITFVLTGSPDLHRILDSTSMSGLGPFTRQRFDLETGRVSTVTTRPPIPPVEKLENPRGEFQKSLAVMCDGVVVERYELLPGRLIIGKSRQCGLRLDSPYVSRNHAAILVQPSQVVVIDLASTNATLVNGRAAARHELEDGDVLVIGDFRLRYDCRGA